MSKTLLFLMENEFLALINANRGMIFKICNLYCDDPEGRKDLFQEVVLQLWRSWPGFRRESAGSTWLYRIALNTAISDFRKQKRRAGQRTVALSELEIPGLEEVHSNLPDAGTLHQAIGRLNDIEKAVIMLYLDEKSYEEISAIIGISISNVGVRINRIKSKLNKILKAV
jgi:RNA polymerase sigma factor (sigma-70 family)